MMMRLNGILARVPRPLLFAAAGVMQVVLIALIVFDRVSILREGAEVTLQTTPVDPRDFLRGDYVTLNYEIGTIPTGALKDTRMAGRHMPLYVKLAPHPNGIYQPVSLHLEPPAVTAPEVLIRGRADGGSHCGEDHRSFCATVRITYGIDRYFVPEGEGTEIERARDKGNVTVIAAVTPAGRAAIKRLLVDGKPVYDEPLF